MPRAVVVQHVPFEPPGLVADALRSRGFVVEIRAVHAGDPVPADAAGIDALVVMGGPMGVGDADRLPHLTAEIALLQSALAAGTPTLGICLGAQLLAHAAGGRVTRGARPEIGFFPVQLHDTTITDPLFTALPRSILALHWHNDVFTPPPGSVALAASALTRCQAFRCGAAAWGVLFHLEFTAAGFEGMVQASAADTAAAGVNAARLRADAKARLMETGAVGKRVFGRFADAAKARAETGAITAPEIAGHRLESGAGAVEHGA